MKKLFSWMITFGIFAGMAWWINPNLLSDLKFESNDIDRVMHAWKNRESNVMVEIEARVVLVLPDLEDTTTYQQFLVDMENGHRLLISHDIGVATPVPVGASGMIRIKGEYDWTENGGKIHWTHKDLNGARAGGWIEHNGTRYQ